MTVDDRPAPDAVRPSTRPVDPGHESRNGGRMNSMTFANVGTLGVVVGGREELVRHLTRRSDALRDVGCLAYEVGVDDEQPNTVFVLELWRDRAAHQASLALPEVQAAITAARPLLSGEFGGFQFTVVGSPLRD